MSPETKTETESQDVKKDEVIKGELYFYLIDSLTHISSVIINKSQIKIMLESLIQNLNQEGIINIKGSSQNPEDFYLVPKENIVAVKFKVINE